MSDAPNLAVSQINLEPSLSRGFFKLSTRRKCNTCACPLHLCTLHPLPTMAPQQSLPILPGCDVGHESRRCVEQWLHASVCWQQQATRKMQRCTRHRMGELQAPSM